MKRKIVNAIGCLVAKWILKNCDEGLLITRKTGTEQVIKVFSKQAYENMIRLAIRRK